MKQAQIFTACTCTSTRLPFPVLPGKKSQTKVPHICTKQKMSEWNCLALTIAVDHRHFLFRSSSYIDCRENWCLTEYKQNENHIAKAISNKKLQHVGTCTKLLKLTFCRCQKLTSVHAEMKSHWTHKHSPRKLKHNNQAAPKSRDSAITGALPCPLQQQSNNLPGWSIGSAQASDTYRPAATGSSTTANPILLTVTASDIRKLWIRILLVIKVLIEQARENQKKTLTQHDAQLKRNK